MKTLLNQVHLRELLDKPVLFDANIFMVGIDNRTSDKNCSFENMKNTYIIPLLESFSEIYIHQEVYKELDDDLEQVGIITFDIIVLNAYIYYARRQDKTYAKALKAIYKRYCGDVIKRHKLPHTLSDYIVQCQNYL